MRSNSSRSPLRSTNSAVNADGLLVLSGYGLSLTVDRGHLVYGDGFGSDRRQGRLSRATCGLRRLVVLGHTGFVSLEAIRWLHEIGAGFSHIDADGTVFATSAARRLDSARLRRAQAVAPFAEAGMAVARDLLRRKLQGQARVLDQIPEAHQFADVITSSIDRLESGKDATELRSLEAMAAAAYWQAWRTIPIQFARRDVSRVPEHWLTFGGRTSPVTGSPRRAANPANALLNYLYALLEAETRIALLTIGLDPGLGVLHADSPARDSLALDVMEAVRPEVDAYVLGLLRSRTFAAREFFETAEGVCRLVSPLPEALAQTVNRWRLAVAPVVEAVARDLEAAPLPPSTLDRAKVTRPKPASARALPTLLTQANRMAAQDDVRRGPQRRLSGAGEQLAQACRVCGVILDRPDRQVCDECWPTERVEAFANAGISALARLRTEGRNPAVTPTANALRGARNSEHQRETQVWEAEHPNRPDSEVFRREILPKLQDVPLSRLMEATGLSIRYCSVVRRGLKTPHPKHWDAFRGI